MIFLLVVSMLSHIPVLGRLRASPPTGMEKMKWLPCDQAKRRSSKGRTLHTFIFRVFVQQLHASACVLMGAHPRGCKRAVEPPTCRE